MERNLLFGQELRLQRFGRRAECRGSALLEVMACMVVLVIAIAAFLAATAQNIQLEAMNSETNIALNAAASVIEEVRGLDYADVNDVTIPPTFTADGVGTDGITMRLSNSAGSNQVGRVAITQNGEGTCKTVHVTVTWRSATGSDRSLALMTEVTDY